MGASMVNASESYRGARTVEDVHETHCLPGASSDAWGLDTLKGMSAFVPAGCIPYHDRAMYAALREALAASMDALDALAQVRQ